MTDKPTLLKVLLKQRHLQGHTAFRREYDRVAKKIEPDLIGGGPSKAQFYRWLSGELATLPYADHCRILEAMFPGWTATELFEPHDGGVDFVPEPPRKADAVTTRPNPLPSAVTMPLPPGVADVVAVFPSRSEFMHKLPPHELFDGAQRIRMSGLSLNLLCQHYPDKALLDLLESGTSVECLFLAPEGHHIKAREREESQPPGHLATLTRLNIEALRRIGTRLSPDAQARLQIRTYDESLRFNITIIDNRSCIVQPYLPDARGVESPTLVMERKDGTMGLYDTFTQVFESMWDRAQEVAE